MKTRVIFRAWRSKRDPAPFALFPDTVATNAGHCGCWAPHEGHGAADYASRGYGYELQPIKRR